MNKKALFLATENAEILSFSLATDYTDLHEGNRGFVVGEMVNWVIG